jgi:hypothetical protein
MQPTAPTVSAWARAPELQCRTLPKVDGNAAEFCQLTAPGTRPGLPDGWALAPHVSRPEIEGVKHFTAASGLIEKAEMSRRGYVRSGK